MDVPPWVALLDGNDALRAQEIEERLSQEWWERWLIYREQVNLVNKEKEQKATHGKR
jgi:hypothetical protein